MDRSSRITSIMLVRGHYELTNWMLRCPASKKSYSVSNW